MKKKTGFTVFVHIVFILMTLVFVLPLIMMVSVSLSNEAQVYQYGFSLIPRQLDITAYKMAFSDFSIVARSMGITILIAIIHPFTFCLCSALIAYAITKEDYRLRKPITWFIVGTMLFSGGTIPTYVVYTQLYNLGNNLLVFILPGLVTAWSVILFRTFFKGISPSLLESAHIDGANEFQIMLRIVVPMSKAIFAIQFFTSMINTWNNFQTSLLYMNDPKLFTIQHVLQRILNDAQVLKTAYAQFGMRMDIDVPIMTMRYAICIIGVLPVLLLFPFVQRFFSKGISVGSVKG